MNNVNANSANSANSANDVNVLSPKSLQHYKNTMEENATLEFLTNPLYRNLMMKQNSNDSDKNNSKKANKEEIKFYRKRITSLSKDMLKGVFPNETLKKIHDDYVNYIIMYFRMIDTKDILQAEYNDFTNPTLNDNENDNELNNIEEFNTINQANQQIMKKIVNVSNLDNYIIKKNGDMNKDQIIPNKKEINLQCPSLRMKGVKDKKDKKGKIDKK